MIVWSVVPDFRYQSFFACDPDQSIEIEVDYSGELIECVPMLSTWKPLKMIAESEGRKVGNFARSWSGGFIVDGYAQDLIGRCLVDVEFLPFLPYGGCMFSLLNVLLCADCLDEAKTKRAIDEDTGKKLAMIHEYHFIPKAIPKPSLFRLPNRIELYAVSDRNMTGEFKDLYESAKLTGLRFEQLWSDKS